MTHKHYRYKFITSKKGEIIGLRCSDCGVNPTQPWIDGAKKRVAKQDARKHFVNSFGYQFFIKTFLP
jgi:hypothetical protein